MPYKPLPLGKVKAGNKVSVTSDGKLSDYSAKNIIIATGARSRELPNLPQDGKKIIGYRDALVLPSTPKKMVIVGSGAIGVEFAYSLPLLFQSGKIFLHSQQNSSFLLSSKDYR